MVSNELVSAIEAVYQRLEEHIQETTTKTGMKCKHLCNVCCRKTNIEASAVEFIPLAAWLYENKIVDEFMSRLDESNETGYCPLFLPDAWKEGKGGCLNYDKRGLVCRLFGFGYRIDREGIAEIVTCKVLKESDPNAVNTARQIGYKSPQSVPLFTNYAMQLFSIHPELSIQQLPIHKAIRLAIEKMYFHYANLNESFIDEKAQPK